MAEIRYNKSIVKNINESLIRKAIRGDGPFTKTKIARITELSFPTVSRIIDDMSKTGEILRNGVDPTTGGRHAMSYIINPDFAYFLCMYVLSGAIRTLVINSLGELVDRQETPMTHVSGMIDLMDKIVEEQTETYPIRALAIGLPWGISNGLIQFGAKDTGLMNFPLQEHMETKYGIRTRVENDMNTMVAGCYARTFREEGGSMVCIHIGSTGLGCGLYLRGHLIRGFHGFAGELRYLPVDDDKTIGTDIEDMVGIQTKDIAKIVAAISCTVDPHTIVFYRNHTIDAELEEVKELCKKYLPEETIPEMIISDQFIEDFESGLILFGKEMLISGYEIVNR